MSRKDVLLPYLIFTATPLNANQTSLVTNIQYLDNVSIQLNWNASATGTFSVQGSLDYNSRNPSIATWDSLTLTPAPVAAAAPGSILLDLNQLSFPYIRVLFNVTDTGSTALLNGFISAKML